MAVKTYCRGFLKNPIDTLTYMASLSSIMQDAITNIGTDWTKNDVTYIDCCSYITVFITYGTNT